VRPLVVSSSPHIHDPDSVQRIMWRVVWALAPAAAFGVFLFGWWAGVVMLAAIASAVGSEAIIQKLRRRPVTVGDGSAVVTGLILALSLPPTVPLAVPVIASVFAIVVAKHLFGGLGHNIWNPAMAGRAFVHISFADWMNNSFVHLKPTGFANLLARAPDAVTTPTPLSDSALVALGGAGTGGATYSYLDMFLGNMPGCIGEVSALLLLAGGLYLIFTRCVRWQVPAVFIGMVALGTWVLPNGKLEIPVGWFAGDPLFHILAGGVFLGAFFIATDMVTTPLTLLGQVIFAVGCGVLVSVIRLWGGYPEGVCFSVLLMNTATPLIDRLIKPKPLGAKR